MLAAREDEVKEMEGLIESRAEEFDAHRVR